MLTVKSNKIQVLFVILLIIFTFNTFAYGGEVYNNLGKKEIPVGKYKALDVYGNIIEGLEGEWHLQNNDSGWMYTGRSATYALKDHYTVLGHFYSGARFRVDTNQSVTSWSQYDCKAWSEFPEGSWADVRITGSYKPNDYIARLSITGETGDYVLQLYAAMDHVYWFYGNGTWYMEVFE